MRRQSSAGAVHGGDGHGHLLELPEAHVSSLGLKGDRKARRLLRRALNDAFPSAQCFGWRIAKICELPPDDPDVGYTAKDGTIFMKLRNPATTGRFYPYGFLLATLLHELTHLSVLGHGKGFYRILSRAVDQCGAEPLVRKDARLQVCAELLNAVCDNDLPRAKALVTVLPEAATCVRPGPGKQLPLEYAAHHGRVAMTRLLLEARANADATIGNDSVAPLARAAEKGNAKTMALLLAARADVAAVEPSNRSALDLAAVAAPLVEKIKSKQRRSESLPSLLPSLPQFRGRVFLPESCAGGKSVHGSKNFGDRAVGLSGSLAL